MYSTGVHLVKANSMHWIDHKICAVGRVVEKIGLYNQYLENVISMTVNAKAQATLEGKYAKLVNTKVLLHCSFFIDVLAEAKNWKHKRLT